MMTVLYVITQKLVMRCPLHAPAATERMKLLPISKKPCIHFAGAATRSRAPSDSMLPPSAPGVTKKSEPTLQSSFVKCVELKDENIGAFPCEKWR